MDPPFQFDAGDRLDGFEIVAPLYAGALAEVYQGMDILTHQDVVIKVPSLNIINNPLVFYHFENEARVLAMLRHPRIVRLIQRDRSSAYHIFEYIPGVDLRKRLQGRNRLSFSKARHYTTQAAQGLSYLHQCGILHLDIKPENLIITPMDTVKLVDFGLARYQGMPDVLREDFPRPHGTPYYAAPEQLVQGGEDPRTDLYSLTMVYYEMLTGQLPFEKRKDLPRVKRRLKADPVPPRHYRAEITVAIEQFILRALSREPEKRPASADEYIRELERANKPATKRHLQTALNRDRLGQTCPVGRPYQRSAATPGGIVVALDDNDKVDTVVETALQEAVVKGSNVTLLTVIAGDDDDDWNRYGDEVRGKRWGQRLEHIAHRFRCYGIEPVVRILSGVPAEKIIETAEDSRAVLIIMGPFQKKMFKRLLGVGTIGRVLKKSTCRVMVAENSEIPGFPIDAAPDTLTIDSLKCMEYFLVRLWAQQLDWLATLVQNGLLEPSGAVKFDPNDNPVAQWTDDLRTHPQWRMLLQWVDAPVAEFNRTAALMIMALRDNRQKRLGELYLNKALPLLCRLREGIRKISTVLRTKTGIMESTRAHLIGQTNCPIDVDMHSGGPVRRIQTLREYFCTRDDPSHELCLR